MKRNANNVVVGFVSGLNISLCEEGSALGSLLGILAWVLLDGLGDCGLQARHEKRTEGDTQERTGEGVSKVGSVEADDV
ncbi:unnamed protein product [Bursaphelenchus xylophilus]|uniref:(pine wood nematode) hypothetical protein n=1 Tax=Bursaphelenchus xylophilus TaxID=6326 RepID=A0A1I7SIB8_BURXY|nr:unnamed protein product [Bursaphelenchus xylophilus]CAG9111908.1 unnamed protein product [Bursaphelenchus xylophilus]